MAKWVPITRGKPKVQDIDSKYKGLLDVRIILDRNPPAEWGQSFDYPSDVPFSLSMHPPRREGSTITITPPDNELDAYVKQVDARIAHANERYEQRLPEIDAARERDQRAHDEEQHRLADARRRAEKL